MSSNHKVIAIKDEIILDNGIEFRVSGSCETADGYFESMQIESIIETGRPNDSVSWIHLKDDAGFEKAIVKKIQHRFPKFS